MPLGSLCEQCQQWLLTNKKLTGVIGLATGVLWLILLIAIRVFTNESDLETISRWKLFLITLMGVPSLLILYGYGDQRISLPAIDERSFLFRVWPESVMVPHLVWLVFSFGMLVTGKILGEVAEDTDIECHPHKWRPMIEPLGYLYITPIFGKGLEIARSIRNMFDPLLYLDVIGVFFGFTYPDKAMPTMNEKMSKEELHERFLYFIPRYCIFFMITFGLFEVMWYICGKWFQLLECWQKLALQADRVKQRIKQMSGSSRSRTPTQDSLEQPILQDTESQSTANTPTQGAPAQKPTATEEESEDEAEDPKFMLKTARERSAALDRFFNAWYIMYQVALYIWTDLIVAGGLVNKVSGTAWEMWSLVFEFNLVTHLATILVRYHFTRGTKHQHPSMLILPSFLPWIGNELHIWKDHASQGLSFALSHCYADESITLSGVGWILGYAGFVATFLPAYKMLTNEICRDGLISAHWPTYIAPRASSKGHVCPTEEDVMNNAIAANTQEKRVRAAYGEVGHLIIHQLFLYFFGGSDFIYISIIISFVKIAMFPAITFFVKSKIAEWGCSGTAAYRYMVNLEIYEDPQPIEKLAKENHWDYILDLFFDKADSPSRSKKNKRIYLIGGLSGTRPKNTVQILDTTQLGTGREWIRGPPMAAARGLPGAAFGNKKIYVMGGTQNYYGNTPLGDMEILDLATSTWSKGPDMITPRFYLRAAFCKGKVYAIGGHSQSSGRNRSVATVEIFDPASNSWSAGPDLPHALTRFGIAVQGSQIIIVGGSSAHQNNSATNQVLVLDTQGDPLQWTPGINMSTEREAVGVGYSDGVIYAAGGSNPSQEGLNTFEFLDLSKGTGWTKGPNMARGREHLGVAACDGKVFAIGGYQNEQVVEIFDTGGERWRNGPRLADGVWGAAVLVA